jgi:TFIIB-like protein
MFDRDALVDTLTQRERAEEDVYFARRDRELLERERARRREGEEERVRRSARMRCPECGVHLVDVRRRGIVTEECPAGHGFWAKPGAIRERIAREHDSWLDRWYPYPSR